ncbi:hypothetical protein ABIA33_004919 [Streptacidiphilus sp. MAP12-16]|uniref:hypothetical protein n=1 Tax=Streptacidiphilus sp. MAP12-16 TaxID=3156300 RepID=UPI0035118AF2
MTRPGPAGLDADAQRGIVGDTHRLGVTPLTVPALLRKGDRVLLIDHPPTGIWRPSQPSTCCPAS